MDIEFIREEKVIIARFNARMIVHSNVKEISQKIENNLEDIKNKKAVIFDFESVVFIDSTSLGYLYKLKDTLDRFGTNLVFSNLVDRVKDIFIYTNFAQHFTIFDDTKNAMNFY